MFLGMCCIFIEILENQCIVKNKSPNAQNS